MVTETQDPRTTSLMEVMAMVVKCREEGKDEVSAQDLQEHLPHATVEEIGTHLVTLAGRDWLTETNRVNFKPPRVWYKATADGLAVLQQAQRVSPAA